MRLLSSILLVAGCASAPAPAPAPREPVASDAQPVAAPARAPASSALAQCRVESWSCNRLGREARSAGRAQESVEIFRAGCEQNALDACTNLGRAHMFGMGTDKDPHAAQKVLDETCAGGSSEACRVLASAHRNGNFGERDHTRADAYLGRACKLGDQDACRSAEQERLRTSPHMIELINAMSKREDAAWACVDRSAQPDLKRTKITVTFSSDGKVVRAAGEAPDAALEACLSEALAPVQIPPFADPTHVFGWGIAR
jgi:hypothetical protein